MWHEYRTETTLPLPREEVFAFFSEAGNLEAITPPQLSFRILTAQPIAMGVGTLIDYRLKLRGVPMKWRTRIAEWGPPHAFTDEQLKGPYRDWIHRHTFEEKGPRETLMRDHVRYRLPFAPLGELVRPFIRAEVRGIFAYREKAIRRELLRESSAA